MFNVTEMSQKMYANCATAATSAYRKRVEKIKKQSTNTATGT